MTNRNRPKGRGPLSLHCRRMFIAIRPESPFRVPRKKSAVLFSIIFVMLVTQCLLGPTPPVLAQPAEGPSMPVVVAPIEKKRVAPTIDLVSTAMAARTSQVAAQVTGAVESIHVQEGDLVQKDDTLIEMDKTNLELSLKQARAVRDGVRVRLQEARKELARSTKLLASRSISEQSLDKDLFNVKNLENSVAAAEAEVRQIEEQLKRMTVSAPFSGYVIAKHTEVGQWLSSGGAVATIADLSVIKVRGSLPARYITHVNLNDAASVTFDALGPEVFRGKVTAVIPEADEKTRNFPIEISLTNPDGRIKVGLLARLTLTGKEEARLLVPKDALVLDGLKTSVFVVHDETVFPVPVITGLAFGNLIEIRGEIAPGDVVVVQGNERLRPKQKVRVMSSDTDKITTRISTHQ